MTRAVITLLLSSLALLGCLYFVAATFAVLFFPRREPVRTGRIEPVTVLKPLCGDEPGLYERLRAFCEQDYPDGVQVVLGLQSAEDKALAAARRLSQAYPDRVEIVLDPRRSGANPKVSNLVNMAKAARHDVLVMSDSDIEVERDYLAKLVPYLAGGTGAVSCLYHGVPRSGFWSRLGAMAIDTYFLPNAVTAMSFGLAQPCFGATIAIRRETLNAIGGLGAYANQLADDYAIGMAVRKLGLKVAVPAFTIGHACTEARFAELWMQELRWARTVRALDPVGYAGTIVLHPFGLAILAAALRDFRGLWLVVLALASRYALCIATQARFGLTVHPYWMVPLREALNSAIFVSSFAGRAVRWREHDYDVARDGAIHTEEAMQ
jgi:ceramide glucosyltransferase